MPASPVTPHLRRSSRKGAVSGVVGCVMRTVLLCSLFNALTVEAVPEADDNALLLEERHRPKPDDFKPKRLSFQEWVNSTHKQHGPFFDHKSMAEGEVLLFRTKKNRHRAIPVMRSTPTGSFSRFSDALTFKEWLRRTYPEEKAIRISVRTTDVVRPVLQHLYATRHEFTAPVIVHANTFASKHSLEKPVDPILFIETVQKLLPEATISLGWTPSADYATLNRLDWSRSFKLMAYIGTLRQPVVLQMTLNDALHSLDQLEWLLGIEQPEIFVLVKADASAFVDAGQELLERLNTLADAEKVIFDADENWRKKLNVVPNKSARKRKRSVAPDGWSKLVFPAKHAGLSTSVVSKTGVAFLGWPNTLLLSNTESREYPAKQVLSGKVLFLPKRRLRHITPIRDSGLVLQLFEKDRLTIDSPKISDTIQILIGYDGRVAIENRLRRSDPAYHQSASGQLPPSSCYEFQIVDRGWRVDAEVATADCFGVKDPVREAERRADETPPTTFRTFVTLDTPASRSRKLRSVGIAKSGDGVIDFMLQELEHSDAPRLAVPLALLFLCSLLHLPRLLL